MVGEVLLHHGCCCGHGEVIGGEKVNNRLVLSTEGARVGVRKKDGVANGWKEPSDFNIWGISIPIKTPSK